MSSTSLPVIAGIASTAIFVGSTLPMLTKAVRTRDLASYSLGNLLLASLGNGVHAIYVFSLPPSPLWLLHSFNLATTGFMLAWFVRYEIRGSARGAPSLQCLDEHDQRPGAESMADIVRVLCA